MTIWLDNGCTGPQAHALVIGVSAYQYLDGSPDVPAGPTRFGLHQLDCAASAAWSIAEWLRDEYRHPRVPLGTVTLLLSPSVAEVNADASLAAAVGGGNVPRARKAEVDSAVRDWWASCCSHPGNVALFYVAGHGIELNREDGVILLLEDFEGQAPTILDAAIDTGNVRRSLTGPDGPLEQLYFVDACRVRPAAAAQFSTASAGIRLDVPTAAGTPDAPIYFSAAPGKNAYGTACAGTFFSQALLECLNGYALGLDFDQALPAISVASLFEHLGSALRRLAPPNRQSVTFGGSSTNQPVHSFATPPPSTLEIDVEPKTAAPFFTARISANGQTFHAGLPLAPRASATVPAGLYLVTTDVFAQDARFPGPAAGVPCMTTPRGQTPAPVVVRVTP